MAVAAADSEMVALENLRQKEKYANKLREIFRLADTDNGGSIDQQEYKQMMRNAEVMQLFGQLDLSDTDVDTLYRVLSHEDGEASYEEFLDAALRMKSSA